MKGDVEKGCAICRNSDNCYGDECYKQKKRDSTELPKELFLGKRLPIKKDKA